MAKKNYPKKNLITDLFSFYFQGTSTAASMVTDTSSAHLGGRPIRGSAKISKISDFLLSRLYAAQESPSVNSNSIKTAETPLCFSSKFEHQRDPTTSSRRKSPVVNSDHFTHSELAPNVIKSEPLDYDTKPAQHSNFVKCNGKPDSDAKNQALQNNFIKHEVDMNLNKLSTNSMRETVNGFHPMPYTHSDLDTFAQRIHNGYTSSSDDDSLSSADHRIKKVNLQQSLRRGGGMMDSPGAGRRTLAGGGSNPNSLAGDARLKMIQCLALSRSASNSPVPPLQSHLVTAKMLASISSSPPTSPRSSPLHNQHLHKVLLKRL